MNQNSLKIYPIKQNKKYSLPLFLSSIKAGFPSPTEGDIEENLDLNELLITHPAATFFVRVSGNSMQDAGISDGDVLIVDRAASVEKGKIVIAVVNGEFTVKRLHKENGAIFLLSANPQFAPLKISDESDFQIWGVVTYIIHKAK